jgi:putative membrane protein
MGFWTQMWQYVVAATIFSVLGIAIMGACYWLMTHFMPFSIVKEIEQDQNTALAIIIGSVLIGMAIIIAAAIFGFAPS